MIGPIAEKCSVLCSDASILRYLRARSYNTKKTAKMLIGTIKWRLEFKPEKIQWVCNKCFFFFFIYLFP